MLDLEQNPVPLGDLVKEAFEDAQLLAQPHGVQVRLGACGQAVVSGDRHRLRQLLLILTDNAVKYNCSGGTIDISLGHFGGSAELRIINTGSALAPKTLENVFERFVRGENAQGKVESCGLGLTIARWIVQAHGGSIQLLSEEPGQTTALVKLLLFLAVESWARLQPPVTTSCASSS